MSHPSDKSVEVQLAGFVDAFRAEDLPANVADEGVRTFVNWLGCALGGSRHRAAIIAQNALAETFGAPQATLIGFGIKADILSASLMNGISSGAHAFDDTHAQMVFHPGGPIAATLLALSERTPMSGRDFLMHLVLGIEIECRLSRAIAIDPAACDLGWYLTGLTGGVGAAAAAAKVMGCDRAQIVSAMGIAASQASGFRAIHGSMCSPLVPAHAGQTGLKAALMALRGFTSTSHFISGSYGFLQLFAERANPQALIDGLGVSYEILLNTYKPYPCGIVVHPAIDAALRLKREHAVHAGQIAAITAFVNPVAVRLADRRHPIDDLQSKVSLQHWIATSFIDHAAGVAQLARVAVPEIVALRDRVEIISDDTMAPDQARIVVRLRTGQALSGEVAHCIGSQTNPMTASDLNEKFRGLARGVIPDDAIAPLLEQCWQVKDLADVGDIGRAAAGIEYSEAV